MAEEKEQKLNATNHYLYYPDEKNVPPYLAYGFRPLFLVLAPYIVFSILMWALIFSGAISIPFMNESLSWHIFEFIYGVGLAGIMAFLFTGLPELFPGTVPVVGKRLKYVVALWLSARVSFFFVDIIGVYIVAFLNISLLVYIISYAFKPVMFDKLQRHSSLGYMLIVILLSEIWFFASMASLVSTPPYEILKVGLGLFMMLELLALRRVNMEALNEILEDEGSDETFLAKPPRYNLALFIVGLFTAIEFFYPDNSALAWLGFAAGAAILGILNDYRLENEIMIFKPFTIYLASVLVLMSLGYFFMGYDYLNDEIYALNHFRHFLTTGVFGLSFFLVMVVISTVHTGRHLEGNLRLHVSVMLIILATFIRAFIGYYEAYANLAYAVSTILWVIPFIWYMKVYFPYLITPRADGIKG